MSTWTATTGKPVRHLVAMLAVVALGFTLQVGLAPQAQAADETAPQVNFKGIQYIQNTMLSDSTSTPSLLVRLPWQQYDPSGVCSVQAQLYNYGTGRYSYPTVQNGVGTNKYVRVTLDRSFDYQLRVYVADCAGNSRYAYTYPYLGELYQETAADLSAGWTTSTCLCWSQGNVFWNTRAGAKASFTFSGRSIAWITDKASNRGSAHIYIDGQYQKTVNLQGAGVNRIVGYAKRFPAYETHTLDIVVVGTSGHPRVDIDAFLVG